MAGANASSWVHSATVQPRLSSPNLMPRPSPPSPRQVSPAKHLLALLLTSLGRGFGLLGPVAVVRYRRWDRPYSRRRRRGSCSHPASATPRGQVCLKLPLTPTLPLHHPTTTPHRWLWRRSPLVVLWIKAKREAPTTRAKEERRGSVEPFFFPFGLRPKSLYFSPAPSSVGSAHAP